MIDNNHYQLICGMEVHAELKTTSKMFCGCKNDPFHALQPNIYTCPVCLGMPGGLPVANKRAIEWTIKLGLALGCKINLFSHFDRKNYFYPDLAKGYQISQYDQPFCYDGILETEQGPVRIRRIHLEEDTGKLIHKTINGEKVSLIDFNRGGVPLIEIVTEPDIHSAAQAKAYTKELRRILRYLDIADCDMEQGGMRLEANISLLQSTVDDLAEANLPKYKVELKNINSFRFLEKAISYEMTRQSEILEQGEIPTQETRGWNEAKGETFSQRSKEDAEDYRYFPDPDLPPLRFDLAYIEGLKRSLPELPQQVVKKWHNQFGVEAKNADLLLQSQQDAQWYQELFATAQAQKVEPNAVANAIVNKKIPVDATMDIATVIQKFSQIYQGETIDEAVLMTAIDEVIAQSTDAVASYKTGKTQVLGFFLGQVQRKLGKKLDGKMLSEAIKKKLD